MGLSRTQIVDAAYVLLREQGLMGLSMRRLAQELGVQPGALYYHVANKQELLAGVAARILDDGVQTISTGNAGQAARDLRAALLRVRDGAEVVSFAQALLPGGLGPCRELQDMFAERFPPHQAEWAARTLVHYVLGFVAEEQNRAELVRTKILDPEALGDETARAAEATDAFLFGVEVIEKGLAALSPGQPRAQGSGRHPPRRPHG